MSGLVSMALDGFLGVLILAALLYGVRLERSLKRLRAGQQDFVAAVAALDKAAGRTQAAVDQLRRDADDAEDGLHDRVLKARALKAELERLIMRAERAATILSQSSGAPAPNPPAHQQATVRPAKAPRLHDEELFEETSSPKPRGRALR